MTRFIIDKDEAVELIFDALRYGIGGEIFIPKIPAMKITDLIQVMKEKLNANNKVKVIGLRPGEKIHEVLINESEITRTYEFNNRYIIRSSVADTYNTAQEPPVYMQNGKLIEPKFMNQYSSDQEIILKNELAELFKKFGLL